MHFRFPKYQDEPEGKYFKQENVFPTVKTSSKNQFCRQKRIGDDGRGQRRQVSAKQVSANRKSTLTRRDQCLWTLQIIAAHRHQKSNLFTTHWRV